MVGRRGHGAHRWRQLRHPSLRPRRRRPLQDGAHPRGEPDRRAAGDGRLPRLRDRRDDGGGTPQVSRVQHPDRPAARQYRQQPSRLADGRGFGHGAEHDRELDRHGAHVRVRVQARVRGGDDGPHLWLPAPPGALAGGAEKAYLPETGISLEQLTTDVAALVDAFESGRSFYLAVMGEEASEFYTGDVISKLFEAEGRGLYSVRDAVIGHVQQGGVPHRSTGSTPRGSPTWPSPTWTPS
ncbi:hypothetical protein G7085_00905 [Tessaracoccus sp. HDW20]|nr:hypothetical protein [Tessaracoccus coleopterorum]